MNRIGIGLLWALVITGLILYAFPSATLTYGALVLLHAGAGLVGAVLLIPFLLRRFRELSSAAKTGWLLLAGGAATGVALVWMGATTPNRPLLVAHIALSSAGAAVLLWKWLPSRRWAGPLASPALRAVAIVGLLVVVAFGGRHVREEYWRLSYRVNNPVLAPVSMEAEGDGPKGLFFPSSAQTAHGGKIPADYFMRSEACQRCHSDIYEQWQSSAHRLSSFNNQWYRASIEYMQDVVGTKPSKWCGGCHDPAVLFSGLMDIPIKEIIDRPEAHAGLGCMMCHSIVQVKSTMGQGDFVVEYPRLHELAATENKFMRVVHDFMVRLNPEPHRRVFMKPFMKEQTADFCSTCHKVHLDVPVNNYRWVRGFNDYDNWQASGVSGEGARSFYYPPKPQRCVDCHMPWEPSNDDANIKGFVHSHRFPAANTALPFVNNDQKQLDVVTKFLQDNIVSVNIFAVSPAEKRVTGHFGPEMSTTFAVGEEAELNVGDTSAEEAAPVTAPLSRVPAQVRRGDDVRVDVVVRTRKVGHFFPGGTVDAFDVWVELKAVDEKGQTIFWSGWVEDDGRGPVEKNAHFYRSRMIDGHGNLINKRNAWANRALVYVRLIPPGAADNVRYRLHVPEGAGEKITLTAKLHYRKFDWFNTNFSYAGVPDPDGPQDFTADYDNRRWKFTGDTSRVSGKLKEIPNLPIITLAEDTAELQVLGRKDPSPEPKVELHADDWEKWNDYGIGLLLQGDLKGAEAAFNRVREVAPNRADGYVNLGRVHVQEGDTARAREVLEKALTFTESPLFGAANFFYARALRSDGEYEPAAEHLRKVIERFPNDRVVRNELGRVFFLQRKYREAVEQFRETLRIDPEDLQAHYNLMLCHNGLGEEMQAQEHQMRYLRFKADEAAQAITGRYRQQNPEDNNERQLIHEHDFLARPSPAAVRRAQSGKSGESGTKAAGAKKPAAQPAGAGRQ